MTATHPNPSPKFHLLIRPFKGRWFRVHRTRNGPVFFGNKKTPGDNRFDAPAGQFGVMYVGRDAHCAFIETFGHDTGVRFVTEAELRKRSLTVVQASRPLRLADLRGPGLARMGADAALTSGHDYALAQRWAQAIHDHPRKPDGIAYRARHDPDRMSAAIFERASGALTSNVIGSMGAQAQSALLGAILDAYRFGLITT